MEFWPNLISWRTSTHEERHDRPSQPKPRKVVQWRTKGTRTVGAVIVLCLNIGVEPPDVMKPSPCARLECWLDPLSLAPQKALESIGQALQIQYERWQPRSLYKQCLDPTVDEVKKICTSLRKKAKEERVLFHYNGHGVPKSTHNGEIWVFNKNYTQYIPLSLFELQSWVGTPSIFVFDSSGAGLILHWFNKFADQREQDQKDMEKMIKKEGKVTDNGSSSVDIRDYILLVACGANEVLPMSPELPADLFTSCLTTPIETALKWLCTQTIISGVTSDLVDKLPGNLTDRRTPFGELNWIFTAVTDTIAWDVLPGELFQKLFRQDLLISSIFRNFLLADRIMRASKCTPISHPRLPPTFNHPMWQSWDLVADHCLAQLPQLISDPDYEYRHSSFFTDQLTTFELWLESGTEERNPPEQLPVVLQVLLSQQHRLHALELIARFLDQGPWAVNQSLSVGIFPYILKLLQSTTTDLRKHLIFIWAKILSVDQSCQVDLVKDNGHMYFISVLSGPNAHTVPVEELQQAAFILSMICNGCKPGQIACLNNNLLGICMTNLAHKDAALRRYVVLTMAKLWETYDEGKQAAIKENIHEKLGGLLSDPSPEVRAAAVYALGTFIGRSGGTTIDDQERSLIEYRVGLTLAVVTTDSSPLVRKELVVSLSLLVNAYEEKFVGIEKNVIKQQQQQHSAKQESAEAKRKARKLKTNTLMDSERISEFDDLIEGETEEYGIYEFLWKLVLSLANDPFPIVAQMAAAILKKIKDQAMEELKVTPIPMSPPKPASSLAMVNEDSLRTSTKTPKIKKIGFFTTKSQLNLKAPSPLPSTRTSVMGVSVPPVVDELRSFLYEWNCQYFSHPILKTNEDETSPTYKERMWKMQRNNNLIQEAKKLKDEDLAYTFENEIAILENENRMVSQVRFHPFENIVVVAEQDSVSVWNWVDGQQIVHFCNQNPPGTRITSLILLNEHEEVRVAIGSDDGVVRIWEGIFRPETLRLVTAWYALPIEGGNSSGLVLEWQKSNTLIASGHMSVLKVWDISCELFIQDIPTNCTSSVTCLTSDKFEDDRLIVAGCGDGSVRLFDQRIQNKYSHVISFMEHKKHVINVFMPCRLKQQIISGSGAGDIKFWDVRNSKSSLKSYYAEHKGEHVMTALAVHHYANILAVGQEQRIKVMNFDGGNLSLIRYHDGFLGQRIGPVTSLCFHPYKVMLGAGATDSIVSIYAGEPGKPKE